MADRRIVGSFEAEFRATKKMADGAIAQLDDALLHVQINPLQNSIAVIVQHMAGNMLSRWTDFLTSDGEKANRGRDGEFIDRQLPRAELLALWERGWKCLFDALAPLTDADLNRKVTIRQEPHSVALAACRQMGHYAWHAGQIALIAKHLKGESWRYLTVPPASKREPSCRCRGR